MNAAAISSQGHHSDGHTMNHDTGPQQAQSRKAVVRRQPQSFASHFSKHIFVPFITQLSSSHTIAPTNPSKVPIQQKPFELHPLKPC